MKKKTPEEIQAMRAEVAAFDREQAAAALSAMRETGKPLSDLVDSEAMKGVADALPVLDKLAAEQADTFPNLRVYVDAVRNGFVGLRQLRSMIPPEGAEDLGAPVAP